MNYFELFGFPVAPAIDRSLLPAKYFELQKSNHPDYFTQAVEAEKEQSLEVSANINKAFAIFQNEQRTIEYFLQTVGLINENEKYSLAPEFLMEMMEFNESLTDLEEGIVARKLADYEEVLYAEILPVISHYDAKETGESDLLKLKDYYYKKKYLNRILERLSD